ncbi:hypothetical protein niasHS_007860 [Heterodera schachtii]|uniref:Uncharacterized protein n=1 Tax=Heterodera schachtii TaxID=97005 RepID=A0ABD2JPV3_HETSC
MTSLFYLLLVLLSLTQKVNALQCWSGIVFNIFDTINVNATRKDECPRGRNFCSKTDCTATESGQLSTLKECANKFVCDKGYYKGRFSECYVYCCAENLCNGGGGICHSFAGRIFGLMMAFLADKCTGKLMKIV